MESSNDRFASVRQYSPDPQALTVRQIQPLGAAIRRDNAEPS
jgi:hypothetical protein